MGPKQGVLNPVVPGSQAPECDCKWVVYPGYNRDDDVAATSTATGATKGSRSTALAASSAAESTACYDGNEPCIEWQVPVGGGLGCGLIEYE